MKKSLEYFSPNIQISTETILKQAEKDGYRNILWTTDIKQELPIFLGKDEFNSMKPITVIENFETAVKEERDNPALHQEVNGKWISYTWNQFHKYAVNFAKAAISIGVEPYQTVNILGFNSPEWFFSFIGGMYASIVPVGIYLTNNAEACHYITHHSDCGVLVVDSIEQYSKYETKLGELKKLKAIVIWGGVSKDTIKSLINQYVPIYSWEDFLSIGSRANVDIELNHRIESQKPGNCCDVVYTSGTTGNPKAVLLSHDNLTYVSRVTKLTIGDKCADRGKIVSYLPLSHIAGQVFDIMSK